MSGLALAVCLWGSFVIAGLQSLPLPLRRFDDLVEVLDQQSFETDQYVTVTSYSVQADPSDVLREMAKLGECDLIYRHFGYGSDDRFINMNTSRLGQLTRGPTHKEYVRVTLYPRRTLEDRGHGLDSLSPKGWSYVEVWRSRESNSVTAIERFFREQLESVRFPHRKKWLHIYEEDPPVFDEFSRIFPNASHGM